MSSFEPKIQRPAEEPQIEESSKAKSLIPDHLLERIRAERKGGFFIDLEESKRQVRDDQKNRLSEAEEALPWYFKQVVKAVFASKPRKSEPSKEELFKSRSLIVSSVIDSMEVFGFSDVVDANRTVLKKLVMESIEPVFKSAIADKKCEDFFQNVDFMKTKKQYWDKILEAFASRSVSLEVLGRLITEVWLDKEASGACIDESGTFFEISFNKDQKNESVVAINLLDGTISDGLGKTFRYEYKPNFYRKENNVRFSKAVLGNKVMTMSSFENHSYRSPGSIIDDVMKLTLRGDALIESKHAQEFRPDSSVLIDNFEEIDKYLKAISGEIANKSVGLEKYWEDIRLYLTNSLDKLREILHRDSPLYEKYPNHMYSDGYYKYLECDLIARVITSFIESMDDFVSK